MKIFGLSITRAAPPGSMPPVPAYGPGSGWWPLVVREPFTGAWQRNVEWKLGSVLAFSTVYACISRISFDIGKLRPMLMELNQATGIWTETESPAFSPVLRKPNRYQTRIKFYEQWISSKLVYGNAYALKERDARGVVTALYLLHPERVRPLIAPDGSVYYQLSGDDLAGIPEDIEAVPATEIIHDLMLALFHPLCGVSPIFACGLAALQGLNIQKGSAKFFANGSNPGGILSAPGAISDETAKRLKDHWEANYTGEQNVGRVAVLGDGLKYEPMTMKATDAQLIDQLKLSSEMICSAFHVPPYMVGVGEPPSYNNIEALNQQYYTQCLQSLIENLELCLDEGLGLTTSKDGARYGVEFDLDGLLRMDSATQIKTYSEGVRGGLLAPNEGRRKLGLKPVQGGNTPYLQQQNYSLAALDRRDSAAPPPPTPVPALPPPDDEPEMVEEEPEDDDGARSIADGILRAARQYARDAA